MKAMTQITQIYNLQSSFTTHDYISKTCIAMVWLAGSGYVMSKNEKKKKKKECIRVGFIYDYPTHRPLVTVWAWGPKSK